MFLQCGSHTVQNKWNLHVVSPPDMTVGGSKFPPELALAKKKKEEAHCISSRTVASVANCII